MKRFAFTLATLAIAAAAHAQVTVKDAWVRATVPQQKATGAFMQLTAAQDAKLVAGSSPVAGVVEIHEMAMDNNVMKMRAIPGLDLPAGKPIAVLSDNSLDHLVLLLAGMHIGRAVCTVSSAYCRLAGTDFSRIHGILEALDPALVYGSDAAVYAAEDLDITQEVIDRLNAGR